MFSFMNDMFGQGGPPGSGYGASAPYGGAENSIQNYTGQAVGALNQSEQQALNALNQGDMQAINSLGQYSGNVNAYLDPYIQAGRQGLSYMSQLGGELQNPQQFYNNFARQYSMSPGVQNRLHTGMQAIQAAMGAQGLLGSGPMAKELTNYTQGVIGQDMNQTFGNVLGAARTGYMDASDLAHQGLSAASAGAGYYGGLGRALAGLYGGMGKDISSLYGGTGGALARMYGLEGTDMAGLQEAMEQQQAQEAANQYAQQNYNRNADISAGAGLLGNILGNGGLGTIGKWFGL